MINNKVIARKKDESEGKIIIEFVGLKSKMYMLNDVEGTENKKGKEINSVVVKSIRYKEYLNVLIVKKIMRQKMKIIQSKLHKIGTYGVCKIFLPCLMIKDTYQIMVYIL